MERRGLKVSKANMVRLENGDTLEPVEKQG
jgi:hypothetical protein